MPIVLDGSGLRRGVAPFKFENICFNEECFKDLFLVSLKFVLVASCKLCNRIKKTRNKGV